MAPARAFRREPRLDALLLVRAGARPVGRPLAGGDRTRRTRAEPRRAREQREAFRSPTVDIDLERAVAELSEGEAVRRALADLSEGERGAIELAYFGGHTYREVAVLLELPEGTVKSRIRSGLLRLRAALIDAGVTE